MSSETAKNTEISNNAKSRLKPVPVKGLSLIYPINGRGGFCISPSRVRYYLVCGSNLELFDVENLLNQFELFLTSWFLSERQAQRIASDKYRKCLDMILANLRYAHLEGKQILSPTRRERSITDNPEKIGYQIVNNVLAFLAERGFINLVRGNASEFKGSCTWCEPTAPLVAIFERHGVYSRLNDKTSLVEVRRKVRDGDSLRHEIVPIAKRQKAYANRLAEPVRGYNELWSKHLPTFDDRYVLPWCRRLFNDSLEYGGRFYGTYQQLPKVDRNRLLIDGEPTTEPDYKAFHINLIYSWENLCFEGDPYQIEGFDRQTIKAVMLPLLNTENLGQLAGQITKSSRPDIKRDFADWKLSRDEHIKHLATGIRLAPVKKPKHLKGFIEQIPEGTGGAKLIQAIKLKHSAIAHHFGTKKIGVRLQKQDSEVMSAVLTKLCESGVPVLPVHDSVRCKVSDLLVTVETMKTQYRKVTGFDIEVTLDERFRNKASIFKNKQSRSKH